jgi:hypothetical protein
MFINVDRVLALIGLFIALPSTMLLFFSDHIAIGILVLVFMLIAIINWHVQNKPLITVLEIEKSAVINDSQGIDASFTSRQKTITNHKGLIELWFRNISSDGVINNILIDNKIPSDIKTEAGDIRACIRFNKPKKAHEQFEATLTFDAKNAFSANTEFVIHVVEAETKKLKLVVELTINRKASDARVFLQYGGNPHKELEKPLISDSGRRLETNIKRPLLGAEYCLEWDW